MKTLLCVGTLLTVVMAGSISLVCSSSEFEIRQLTPGGPIRITVTNAESHTVEIDDAAGFRTPLLRRAVGDKVVEIDPYEAGMAPGIEYYVRIVGSSSVRTFHLITANDAPLRGDCGMMRSSWQSDGHPMLDQRSAVHWNQTTSQWENNPKQQPQGLELYFTELFLRSALESAYACRDFGLYDEVAQYYLVILKQTVPLSATYEKPIFIPATAYKSSRRNEARTFVAGGNLVGDSELGNVQWLYPAAKLLRMISMLPSARRSPLMTQFASQYTEFIVNDQLLRFLTRPARPAPGGGADISRIAVWGRALAGMKGKVAWETAMSDIDLWLLASSAEVLGANANDPALVPLADDQVTHLRSAIESGIRLFRAKRTSYPDTKDFQGKVVGSASYFNGDYDSYPDLAGSAYSGASFPTADQRQALRKLSWDLAHSYRIPVFLRSLYDAKKVTRSDFPRYEELRLLTNQYVYNVFNGDFSRPLFRNYLDGHDTWFRVGTNGPDFGYPPSQFCDMRTSNRWCMAPGSVVGWGLLAFVNSDLDRVEDALLKLALDPKEESQEFRNRHYSYQGPFEIVNANGRPTYGSPLFFLIADNAPTMANGIGSRP